MSDRISLTVPRARPYVGVAQLVLGGVAMRENFTLEALEDLQLAVDEVLARERGDGRIEARLGPFEGSVLHHDLEPSDERLGLRRVLDTTVDSVSVETRAD